MAGRVHGDAPVAQAVQPAVTRPDPERPVCVLRDRLHRVARKTLGGGVGREAAVAEARQAAALGTDPDVAVAIAEDRPGDVSGQAFGRRVGLELAVAEPVHSPVLGADPEVAFAVLEEAQDLIVREPPARVERGHGASGHPDEPRGLGADPQAAVAIAADRRSRRGPPGRPAGARSVSPGLPTKSPLAVPTQSVPSGSCHRHLTPPGGRPRISSAFAAPGPRETSPSFTPTKRRPWPARRAWIGPRRRESHPGSSPNRPRLPADEAAVGARPHDALGILGQRADPRVRQAPAAELGPLAAFAERAMPPPSVPTHRLPPWSARRAVTRLWRRALVLDLSKTVKRMPSNWARPS